MAACGVAEERYAASGRLEGRSVHKMNWGSIAAQPQPVLPQLVAYLGQRGHAEVLGLQQFVRTTADEVAQRVDAEPVHALAGTHRQIEIADGLVHHRLLLIAERLLRRVAALERRTLLQRL